jgi:hypothetical protein
MKLKHITISPKEIKFKQTTEAKKHEDTQEIITHGEQEPLPEFNTAFDDLRNIFCDVCELPKSFAEGLTITKLTITYTKQGTRSVSLAVKKELETRTDHLWAFECPFFQVDEAVDGESGSVKINKEAQDAFLTAIHEAERYAAGDRSQGLLNFDESKAALQATADKGQGELGIANEG